MIRLENVSKVYPGGVEALRRLTLQVERGSLRFIAGPSGAGKTTLLRLLGLIERPTSGRILVHGIRLDRLRNQRAFLYRRRVGFIFQDHNLLHEQTVFENVSLPLLISGYRSQDIDKRVHAALLKVGLEGRERMYPLALSSGEQQRVGIARAIVHRPSVLLADEPTGNLDPGLSKEIMRLFHQLNQIGITVIVATHDLASTQAKPNEIVNLRNGKLVIRAPIQ